MRLSRGVRVNEEHPDPLGPNDEERETGLAGIAATRAALNKAAMERAVGKDWSE